MKHELQFLAYHGTLCLSSGCKKLHYIRSSLSGRNKWLNASHYFLYLNGGKNRLCVCFIYAKQFALYAAMAWANKIDNSFADVPHKPPAISRFRLFGKRRNYMFVLGVKNNERILCPVRVQKVVQNTYFVCCINNIDNK